MYVTLQSFGSSAIVLLRISSPCQSFSDKSSIDFPSVPSLLWFLVPWGFYASVFMAIFSVLLIVHVFLELSCYLSYLKDSISMFFSGNVLSWLSICSWTSIVPGLLPRGFHVNFFSGSVISWLSVYVPYPTSTCAKPCSCDTTFSCRPPVYI